ncbi:MAG: hypothetical protein P8182_19140 [Deltaproteobacteria bacterium]
MDYLYRSTTRVDRTSSGLVSRCEVEDEVFRAWVEITVQPPALEVVEARADITAGGPAADELVPTLERMKGVRVGSGMNKIVPGVFQGSPCPRLAEMFLDAMGAVILSLTRPLLRDFHARFGRPADGADAWLVPALLAKEGRESLLADNPRLYKSCVAFPEEE